MPTVFVTGGTGFIGGHLIERLLENRFNVVCLVRPNSNTNTLRNLGVEIIDGDVCDKTAVEEGVHGSDVIVHCAGILGGLRASNERQWETNTYGPLVVSKAASKFHITKLIHLSSAGVYGFTRKKPTDERTVPNPKSSYGWSKLYGETMVEENRGDVPTIILRPSLVYGPRDRHLLKLYTTIKKGFYFNIGGGKALLQPVYISDLIDAILSSISYPSDYEIFNIAGQKPVTYADFASIIAESLNTLPPKLSIPKPMAMLIAGVSSPILSLFGEPPLTPSRVKSLTNNKTFSIEKAESKLKWKPKTSLRDGMKKTVTWAMGEGLL